MTEIVRVESPSRRVFIIESAARGKSFVYKIVEPQLRKIIQHTFDDRRQARDVMQADLIAEEIALRAGNVNGHSFAAAYAA